MPYLPHYRLLSKIAETQLPAFATVIKRILAIVKQQTISGITYT